jgi:hypothetical protein
MIGLAACGGDNHGGLDTGPPVGETPDAAMADAAMPDAPLGPPLTVVVSPRGDDTSDGIVMAVKTLKRGVAVATANHRVTEIVVAAGSYTTRNGEAFPYTVPAGVKISGPVGGGAILQGSFTETGLILNGGQLHDVELDQFATALEGAGELQLTNVRVASSHVAVHADAGAKLKVDQLDITGPATGVCTTGLSLDSGAGLTATMLTTHDLGTVVAASDAGAIDISTANIVASVPDPTCGAMINVMTTRPFALTDSTIDGGVQRVVGVSLVGQSSTGLVQATITRTDMRHLTVGVQASGMALQLSGGTIESNGVGIDGGGEGTWSLARASFFSNGTAIAMHGFTTTAQPTLTMRDSGVQLSSTGISIADFATADLGTAASPGNNVISFNDLPGLSFTCTAHQPPVTAVGNTWRANVQGSDAGGHYPVTDTISGPITFTNSTNFAISAGCGVIR